MSDDTMLNIFKQKLDDELGITKESQGLKKKINMLKGKELAEQADKSLTTKMTKVVDESAKYLKQLKDSGLSMNEATTKAKNFAKTLKDAAVQQVEIENPGYQEGLNVELRKRTGAAGLIKDKQTTKKKATTKKSTKKKSTKKKAKK